MPPSSSSWRATDPMSWPDKVRSTLPPDHPAYLAPGQSSNARNILARLVGSETAERLIPATVASDHRGEGKGAQPQRAVSDVAVRPAQIPQDRSRGSSEGGGKFRIVVTSFRRRLLDDDNLAPKYHIDGLRYCGVIPDDRPGIATIETRQEKVDSPEAEQTVIQIYPPHQC